MNRLSSVHRRLVYAVGVVLLLSGLYWAAIHYLGESIGFDPRQALAANALLMKIHGGAAMIALILLGSLLPGHVRFGWRGAVNKKTGILMLVLAGLLIGSGYLLYYAGDEMVRQLSSYVHLGLGVALPLPLVTHVWRRARATAASRTRARGMRSEGVA